MQAIAKLMLAMAKANNEAKEGLVVAIDRTNWQPGQKHINILMASVYSQVVGYPVVWKVLPQQSKQGNSTTEQRIESIQRLLTVLPASDKGIGRRS